jgi:hypothetical protein
VGLRLEGVGVGGALERGVHVSFSFKDKIILASRSKEVRLPKEYNETSSEQPPSLVELVDRRRHSLHGLLGELVGGVLLGVDWLGSEGSVWWGLLIGRHQLEHVSLQIVELAFVLKHFDDMVLLFFGALAVH